MAIQTEPTRIQIPFADSGTKNVIPDTNSTPSASQAASWTDGFPAQCSLPLSAGGMPPARADFNGIFNAITQSERFTEEGGVWAWDATVDYGTNRIVLGSDNLLYWSVAQSGPNVGGAQDPTTDDGTYWGPAPMVSPAVLDDSSKLASTKWVRDAVGPAPLYVDPTNGNDANDGLTSGNSVKTISRALDLSDTRAGGIQVIYLASDTYVENVTVSNRRIQFTLEGNATIQGSILFSTYSNIVISGAYTLSISSGASTPLSLEDCSSLVCNSAVATTSTGANSGLSVLNSSHAIFNSTTTCSGTCTNGIVFKNSTGVFVGSVTINATCSDYNIFLSSSLVEFIGSVTQTSSPTNYDGIYVAFSSVCIFNNSNSVSHTIKGHNRGIDVTHSSMVLLTGQVSISILADMSGGANCLSVNNCSCFYSVSTGTITFSAPNGVAYGVFADSCSAIYLKSDLVFNIVASSVVLEATRSAVVNIPSSVNISGTSTGQRYFAAQCSAISVYGAGANRIPGSSAGSVQTSSYGVYL